MADISQFLSTAVFLARFAFWTACIVFAFLCLIPTAYLDSAGLFDWWDKAQHVLAFFCLCILGIFSYQTDIGKIVVGLLIYGCLIEVLQWQTGWRSGEFADWIADVIGILFGVLFMNRLICRRS